jgi:hypothetical protein
MAAHRASVSGSLVGRFAFIGNSVRGRLTVSFHSGMVSIDFIMTDAYFVRTPAERTD